MEYVSVKQVVKQIKYYANLLIYNVFLDIV